MKFHVINSNALHVDCIIHLKFFERTSWLEKYENMGFVFKCVNKYIFYLSCNYHPGDVQYTFLHQISIYSVHHACLFVRLFPVCRCFFFISYCSLTAWQTFVKLLHCFVPVTSSYSLITMYWFRSIFTILNILF